MAQGLLELSVGYIVRTEVYVVDDLRCFLETLIMAPVLAVVVYVSRLYYVIAYVIACPPLSTPERHSVCAFLQLQFANDKIRQTHLAQCLTATVKMSAPADKKDGPWDKETKEKFNR